MSNTALVIYTKQGAAQAVVQKWCEQYERAREDIPALIERGSERLSIGRLVYALRKYIDLDPISCGELLAVHPSYVSRLQARMNDAIEVRHIREVKNATREFLTTCGFICPKEPPSVSDHSKRDAQTQLWLAQLEDSGPRYISMILRATGRSSLKEVFGYTKHRGAVEDRYIVFGVLFHVVLGSHGHRAVGAYCKSSSTAVFQGLRELHETIASGKPPAFREKIERICSEIGISPTQLLPS